MKVLITDNTHPVLRQHIEAAGIDCDVCVDCTYNTLLEMVQDYDALIVRSKIIIDRPFIDKARHLRCIGRVGAGMETIDVEYAESCGVKCFNSPEGNRDAVGEHATALLLALFDKITIADAEVRQGQWHREDNRGIEVKGRTVGIIGFGNMGGAFAQRLRGFECRILAYDKYRPAHCEENFVKARDYVVPCSLDTLQHEADVVSLHVPLTEETRYMVNADFIGRMTHPFYLLNTSRGAVVKTADLVAAMESGQVLGAGLDVIEYENMAKDGLVMDDLPNDYRYLLRSPHTVMTPHVAGWTVESKYKLATVLADKIVQCLRQND